MVVVKVAPMVDKRAAHLVDGMVVRLAATKDAKKAGALAVLRVGLKADCSAVRWAH